ncbi:MAG TPA: hypothetical protein VHB48_07990 [Chitinophagaceae bacterium]|nr:hypothetical protein [Chitinophagaceae bacterium]
MANTKAAGIGTLPAMRIEETPFRRLPGWGFEDLTHFFGGI